MGSGHWRAAVHGVAEELDMNERPNNIKATKSNQEWDL